MRVISGAAAGLPEGYYGRVTHYRHRVFVEQLGWRLQVHDGAETDQFDRPDTVYVMVEDEPGNIVGCSRLLQTTRPYVVAELFPQLLNGLPPPHDATVWELSRFAAMNFNARAATPLAQFASSPTALLMRASVACAAERGARRLITASPVGIERLIRRLGLQAHRAGPPMMVDGHAIFACWIEVQGSQNA
jgi:acyl homoserine lactone synthase